MTAPNPHSTNAVCLAKLEGTGLRLIPALLLRKLDVSIHAIADLASKGLIEQTRIRDTLYYRLTPDGLAIAQAHEAAGQAVSGA